jgi:hypothetical protein
LEVPTDVHPPIDFLPGERAAVMSYGVTPGCGDDPALGRASAIGAIVGFFAVGLLVGVPTALFAGLGAGLGIGTMVGAFGGVGFGFMIYASYYASMKEN